MRFQILRQRGQEVIIMIELKNIKSKTLKISPFTSIFKRRSKAGSDFIFVVDIFKWDCLDFMKKGFWLFKITNFCNFFPFQMNFSIRGRGLLKLLDWILLPENVEFSWPYDLSFIVRLCIYIIFTFQKKKKWEEDYFSMIILERVIVYFVYVLDLMV